MTQDKGHQSSEGPKELRSPEEVKQAIEETKAAIAQDARALGENFSPRHLKQGAQEVIRSAKDAAVGSLRDARDHAVGAASDTARQVSERVRKAGSGTVDFMSANAIPLAVIGVGVGWLMMTRRHHQRLGVGPEGQGSLPAVYREQSERVQNGIAGLRARASERLGAGKQAAAEAKASLRSRAAELSDDARARARGARHKVRGYTDRSPVVIGLMAAAAGIAVGFLFPSSAAEDRWFGDARDQWLHGTRDSIRQAQHAAQRAAGEIRDAARGPNPSA